MASKVKVTTHSSSDFTKGHYGYSSCSKYVLMFGYCVVCGYNPRCLDVNGYYGRSIVELIEGRQFMENDRINEETDKLY